MVRQLDAVFESRVLRLLGPLELDEHQRVRLTLDDDRPAESIAHTRSQDYRKEEALWLANSLRVPQLRQEHSAVPHQIEHIVARQHGGSDDIEAPISEPDRFFGFRPLLFPAVNGKSFVVAGNEDNWYGEVYISSCLPARRFLIASRRYQGRNGRAVRRTGKHCSSLS